MRIAILIACLVLAGCAVTAEQDKPSLSAPLPPLVVAGPKFSGTAFGCGAEPAPPDPAADPQRQGSAAALDRESLADWGRGCQSKLNSAGRRLDAAGQVIR